MIELVLSFFGEYLIEFMSLMISGALFFRYAAYRHSKRDEAYFSKFTREIEQNVDLDKAREVPIENVEDYLSDIMGRVNRRLPSDSLRFGNKNVNQEDRVRQSAVNIPLKDYVSGTQGLVASIQSESSVFNCKSPPDFSELTSRVMSDDISWTKLYGKVPIDGVSRMIDILPSLFIVFGVFGTFIGISMALPEIAKIDFSDLETSGQTLTAFVVNVTYAMKTSIAGIFYSLILTFLNTLFPLDEIRDRTFQKVETCMHLLWYHIQNDNVAEHKKEGTLPQVLKVLQKISSQLDDSIKRTEDTSPDIKIKKVS